MEAAHNEAPLLQLIPMEERTNMIDTDNATTDITPPFIGTFVKHDMPGEVR